MRAAVLRGFRPTTLTHRRQPQSEWDDLDFVLLEALQVIDDEMGRTGLPIWQTRVGTGGVLFEVREKIDLAQEALDEFDKRAKGPKGDKSPPPGTVRYVVAITADGKPAPEGGLARERALKALGEEERAVAAPVLEGSDILIERRRPKDGYDTSQYG